MVTWLFRVRREQVKGLVICFTPIFHHSSSSVELRTNIKRPLLRIYYSSWSIRIHSIPSRRSFTSLYRAYNHRKPVQDWSMSSHPSSINPKCPSNSPTKPLKTTSTATSKKSDTPTRSTASTLDAWSTTAKNTSRSPESLRWWSIRTNSRKCWAFRLSNN